MKFKVDEKLSSECASLLRDAGWEADTVGAEGLSGADDQTVARFRRESGRILVTLDLDFANPFTHPAGNTPGIIILRSKQQNKRSLLALARRLLAVLRERSPERQIWIVQPDRIRVRPE